MIERRANGPVGKVRHGQSFAKFVEYETFVVKKERKGRRARVDLSAEPKKRRGKVELPPSLYFRSKVKREASLVLLGKTGPILVQHVEAERCETGGEGSKNKLSFLRAAALARVQVFAARVGRCSCSRRHDAQLGVKQDVEWIATYITPAKASYLKANTEQKNGKSQSKRGPRNRALRAAIMHVTENLRKGEN
jgi:hypothetical protein